MQNVFTANPEPKKRTRRRLRVSCVECTRRRQKCDRQQPCGLCKSRNVGHLCRWELEPFARPPPTRPPGAATTAAAQKSAKRAVSDSPRTRSLTTDSSSGSGTSESQSPLVSTPSTTENVSNAESSSAPLAKVEVEVKEAAIALAQLSVARHNEYLGIGSVVCALHKLNDTLAPLPTDTSSPYPFNANNNDFTDYNTTLSQTFTRSLQELVANFPDKSRCDALINDFFYHENWFYGLPEKQVMRSYKDMWWTIQADLTSIQRINFNWVALLFSIFAMSPSCESEDETRKYYLQALTSRRLAEDMLSASFLSPRESATNFSGTAYGCLAASIMARYLCDRGQMTEAWKLIGSALRCAQNSGLHLNPYWNRWKDMTREEQVLRSIAFHQCAFADRLLSFCLGRPLMARHRDFDVPLCAKYTEKLELDGSSDTTGIFMRCKFEFMCYIGEEKDRYLSVHPDKGNGATSFEAAMAKWEAAIPPFFRPHDPDTSYDAPYPHLRNQRDCLSVHFFGCRMLFYRSLPCAQVTSVSKPRDRNTHWDIGQLSTNAMLMLEPMKALIAEMRWKHQICFTLSHLTFEAGVTLSICILRDPRNPRVEEWCRVRDECIEMLQSVAQRDNGNLVKQSLLVLRVLQDQRSRQGTQTQPLQTLDTSSGLLDASVQSQTTDDIPFDEGGILLQSLDPQLVMAATSLFPDISKSMDFALGDRIPSGMDGSFSAFDFLFGTDEIPSQLPFT